MIGFPNVLYKGNSASTSFNIKQGSEDYTFQNTDIVRVGIKQYIGQEKYILRKEFIPNGGETSITIHFTAKETQEIPTCKAILEVELEYNSGQDIKTVYQQEIDLKGVVIDE